MPKFLMSPPPSPSNSDETPESQLRQELQELKHRLEETTSELVQTKARFMAAEQGAGVGVFEWNPKSEKTYFSPQWKSMLGYEEQELDNTTDQFTYLLHPNDIEPTWTAVKEAMEGSCVHYESEFRLRHKEGTYRWILSRSLIFRDHLGHPLRFIGAHIDITEQKHTEKTLSDSLQLIDTLLDASPAGIAFFDHNFRYVRINRALAENINGLPQQAHLGRTVQEILPALGPVIQKSLETVLKTGQPIINEEFVGNTPRWPEETRAWLASFYPLFDKDRMSLGAGAVFLDITERKRAQQEMALMAEELKRSNRDLEQFASVASHDLKEPLRAVESYLGLLDKKYAKSLEPIAQRYIQYAREGARRMYQLVEALREYARSGTAFIEKREIDTREVLTTALLNLDAAVRDSQANITYDSLPRVHADPIQLERVFQNLISNAIKFSRSDEPPKIHVSAKYEGPCWIFSVRDHGIGMPPKDNQRIFEIFKRLHNSDRYPGDGLGLSISKNIIERHGGKIWVESTPGQGCLFFFSLPRSPAQ